MDSQAREVSPGEMRLAAENELRKFPNDNLTWLQAQRDFAAADAKEAFALDDKIRANAAADKADRFAKATEELRVIREKIAVAEQLLFNRLVVALNNAKSPPWSPTHRHYKGALYRVTGTKRQNAEHDEPIDGIEYDDAEGHQWWLPRQRWESFNGAGKPRYAAILPGDRDD